MTYKVKAPRPCYYCDKPTHNINRDTHEAVCLDCGLAHAAEWVRIMGRHKRQGFQGLINARDEFVAWRDARRNGATQGNQQWQQLSMLDGDDAGLQ